MTKQIPYKIFKIKCNKESIMYWNYRVMKRVVDGDTFYGIYEVTYDTNSKEPALWDENPTIEEESIERLMEELVEMLGACYKDVLDHDATPAGSRELDEALSEALGEMKKVGWDGMEKFPIKEAKVDVDYDPFANIPPQGSPAADPEDLKKHKKWMDGNSK